MRGRNERQAKMLLGVTPDDLVPAKHPATPHTGIDSGDPDKWIRSE